MTKLDYSISDAQERAEIVTQILEENNNKVSQSYMDILSDYIISAITTEEKKSKTILTDNRLVTINKRETSYEGLVSQFENGEDGLWNLTIEPNKNILLTPKISIEPRDLAEIPALADLKSAIEDVNKMFKNALGKRKFQLKKQLIEMHQEQYIIKDLFRKPITSAKTVKNFSRISLADACYVDALGEPHNDGLLDFFNPAHISAILCNYSSLKECSWGKFDDDLYYAMEDFDNLVEAAIGDDMPIYKWIIIHKIDGRTNAEIQEVLAEQYDITYSVEYISSLWRNKIPKIIAEVAKERYLDWYFRTQEKGQWKTCSKCGKEKLATNRFFSKNGTSKDGFYSICKDCRNKKEKKEA